MKNFIFLQVILVVLSGLFILAIIGIPLSDLFIQHYKDLSLDQLDANAIDIAACLKFKSVCQHYAIIYGIFLLIFLAYSIVDYYFINSKKTKNNT